MEAGDDDLNEHETEKDLLGEGLHDGHVALSGPLERLSNIVEVVHDYWLSEVLAEAVSALCPVAANSRDRSKALLLRTELEARRLRVPADS